MKWFAIMPLAALLAVAPAAAWPQQPAGKTTPPAAPAKAAAAPQTPAAAGKIYTPEEKQAYQKKATAQLDQLQQQIGAFKVEKMNACPPQKKRTYARAFMVLEKKEILARNKLAALEKASKADWSRLKAETDQALADVQKTYTEAEQGLK